MDEYNEDGTTTYDNGTTETTYGAGYGDPSVQDAYQSETQTENDLYEASSAAQLAGDGYGAYELNEASIEAGSAANDTYDEYNGTGEYAPTEAYSPAPETPAADPETPAADPVADVPDYTSTVSDPGSDPSSE